MTHDDLFYSMREVAHLATGKILPRVEEFTSWDGVSIPLNKKIRVTVEYIDIPDPETTPVLNMEEMVTV